MNFKPISFTHELAFQATSIFYRSLSLSMAKFPHTYCTHSAEGTRKPPC